MGKFQNKKFNKKGKKGPDGENQVSGDTVKAEGVSVTLREESEKIKADEVVGAGGSPAKTVDGVKDATEGVKQDREPGTKPSTDGNQEKKDKTPKRRRKRGKKAKTSPDSKPAEKAKPATGKPVEKEKKAFSGLIFMCNKSTKQDCFQHRVFGLPDAKKDIVERVTPGMKLFLFDIDLRLLYGVYEASSKGGLNLEPKAFRNSDKGFPAQVRFRIKKDSLPLSEDDFKPAIKDNYFGKNKFNIELSPDQVKSLQQLFRPIAPNSKNSGAGNTQRAGAGNAQRSGAGNTQRAPRGGGRFERPVPRPGYKLDGARDFRSRRDVPYYDDLRYSVPEYAPPPLPAYGLDVTSDLDLRRLDYSRDYSRDPGFVPADPYLLARAPPLPDISADPGYGLVNPALEVDPLYRQRYPIYSDPSLRQAGKRPFDDLYLDDHHALPVPKRAHLQDDLIYRDLEYQRAAAPYTDDRILSRYYAGAPW